MTFTPVKKWTLPYEAESASVCVPQNRFVAGGADMWVHVHDMATGNEVDVGKGHHGPVHRALRAGGMSYAGKRGRDDSAVENLPGGEAGWEVIGGRVAEDSSPRFTEVSE